MSDDTFLYSRCVALINGPSYYERVKQGKENDLWNMDFRKPTTSKKNKISKCRPHIATVNTHIFICSIPLSRQVGAKRNRKAKKESKKSKR